MGERTVTVFGGTGFLGRQTVSTLIEHGFRVTVASRHPERLQLPGKGKSWQPLVCDIRDEPTVARALEGADAAVNAVSLYEEKGDLTFDAIHVQGAQRIARCAREGGIERLVLVSGIGASTDSPSQYVRARARGEEAVRAAFPGVTVLRPSVLFGPTEGFTAALDAVTRLPVIPLFGRGQTRLQPVYVEDVALAVAQVLSRRQTAGRLFELGGGRVYSYREAVRLVLSRRGRNRPMMPFPFPLWHALASLLSALPSPPITHDQLYLLEEDNVPGKDALTFADLELKPRSLEEVI